MDCALVVVDVFGDKGVGGWQFWSERSRLWVVWIVGGGVVVPCDRSRLPISVQMVVSIL